MYKLTLSVRKRDLGPPTNKRTKSHDFEAHAVLTIMSPDKAGEWEATYSDYDRATAFRLAMEWVQMKLYQAGIN